MKNFLFNLLFFIVPVHSLIAGEAGPGFFTEFPDHKVVYRLTSDYSFSSDAITNKFAREYYNKGFISNSLKDGVSKNLYPSNRFGAEFKAGITVAQKLDTLFGRQNFVSYFRVEHKAHIESSFSRDLFEIYFRGNKNYADKTAELGPFHLKSYSYQQFTYGIEQDYIRKEKRIIWSAGLSLNIGQKYNSYDSPGTSLYTASDGSFLDLDLHLRMRQNDSSQSRLGSFNGFGFSGQASLSVIDEDQNVWNISAENLGFISWTKESSDIPIDSSFRFIGIDVSDLFDFGDTLKKQITTDSAYVQAFLTERQKKSFADMLPFHIKVSYSKPIKSEKAYIHVGAEHILFSEARLRGFAGLDYKLGKKQVLGVNISYGGYTFWNLGLSYTAKIGKSWTVQAGSDYLSAIMNPDGLAQGAFVSLQKYF